MTATTVLLLPGYGDSGPEHWQSVWERRFGYTRVEQDDWLEPVVEDWVRTLDRAVAAQRAPVVLVAHSLGCALAVRWASTAPAGRVRAALMVAPADVESDAHTPDEVRSFAPLPTARLPFPSVLVASEDDPFMRVDRARWFAARWGSRFVSVGARGHLNAESGIGDWPEGHRLLEELL